MATQQVYRCLTGAAVLWLWLSLLQACAPSEPPRSPFENALCELPCWYNITPGISTENDVEQTLARLQLDNSCQEVDFGFVRGIRCDGFGVWFRENENVVDSITLTPSETITLDEVVREFGAPDFLAIDEVDDIPEAVMTVIEIYYVGTGLSLLLANPDENYTFEVSAKFEVSRLTYRAPIHDDTAFFQLVERDYLDAFVIPWKGYTNYEQFIP